ncbi:uncharacterized protein LOC127846916 isoform X2 [Dreissena polymorpha]|uniref:Ig-like domain-containing protein n=2 Tax=Dreissena polymorpha TaxID=45954 RepID=A0A9D4I517_DREPO|nr:uncharacterized protein LOC127846916 isoform X2 [Dreissena polymorpha]KAH3746742.1 hypothetical protein DPMN_181157 [Dreissena polymorpha]
MRCIKQLLLLFLAMVCARTEGPLCFECGDVPEVSTCEKVVRCYERQKCLVQRLLTSTGRSYYKLGCADLNSCISKQTTLASNLIGKRQTDGDSLESPNVTSQQRKSRALSGDIIICDECATDIKEQLTKCGSQPPNGKLCFKCDNLVDPHSCDTVRQCNSEEECFLGLQPSHINGEMHYSMDCRRHLVCQALLHLQSNINCLKCCSESFCNYGACDAHPTTTVTTTTTTTTTTTKPTTTTPPKPVVAVIGPSTADYNSNVTLKCQTDGSVDSYMWTKDGHVLSISTSTLVIPALNSSTAGRYVCAATRYGQTGMAELMLQITTRPGHVIKVSHYIDNEVSVLSLKCITSGYPFPNIQWSFVGTSGPHDITNLPFNMKHSFGIIFDYRPSVHNGNYTCRASNSVGGDSKTTTVH